MSQQKTYDMGTPTPAIEQEKKTFDEKNEKTESKKRFKLFYEIGGKI